MGFLGRAGMAGAAGGANQALQNFLNFYMQNKELKQREAQMLQQKALQEAQIQEYQARTLERQGEMANRQGMMSALGSAVTPGGEYPGTTGEYPVPYAPKMDYERAMTGALPYLDSKTAPQFDALMKIRQLPIEEQKNALAQLVQFSQISRNRAQEAKALRPEKEERPNIPLYETRTLPGGKMKQKFMWNLDTKQHDTPFGEPEPIHVFAPKDPKDDSAVVEAYKLWSAAKKKRKETIPDFDYFYEKVYKTPNAAAYIFGGTAPPGIELPGTAPKTELKYNPQTGKFE